MNAIPTNLIPVAHPARLRTPVLKGLLLLLSCSVLLSAQSFSTQVLEDFSQGMRYSGAGNPLWQIYGGEGEGDQVATVAGGQLILQGSQHTNCTTTKGCGLYLYFYSKGGGFAYPTTYTQNFVMAPFPFTQGTNHVRFTMSCSNPVPHSTSGNGQSNNLQIGTYIRDRTNTNVNFQGQHYYHFFNLNVAANHPMVIDWNAQPQHVVTVSGLVNYDPEAPGTAGATQNMQYFDGLTEWYFDTQNAGEFGWTQWANNTCKFSDYQMYVASKQPEAYVAGLWGQYDGSNYEYGFSIPYTSPQTITYDVAYSTSSLHANGWASGTSGGSIKPVAGSGYVSVAQVLSPALPEQSTFYLAVRPHIPITAASGSAGNPIQLTTYTNHLLTTGDTIFISGSCSAANGAQTITSTGPTTFTLNGSIGAGCSSKGGSFYGQEYFSEIWIGGAASSGTPATNACSLTGAATVTQVDVQSAIDAALGIGACKLDLDHNGRCDVVDLQRVINAMNTGICRVGP